MGGIPWKSKGCRNCKKRKVKCDEQRPECARCIKYGTKCLGYERDSRFVIYSASASPQWAAQRVVQPQALNYIGPHALPAGVTAGPARREQVLSTYVEIFFPSAMEARSSFDLWYYLISNFCALPRKTEMLERSLSALACIYLGKKNHDTRMVKYGVQLYNWAIRAMAHMIARDAYCDDIIYTTVLFQEIETYHCPNGLQGWVSHVAGTNAILSHFRRRPGKGLLVDTIYNEYQKQRLVMSAQGIYLNKEEFDYVTQPSGGNPTIELLRLFAYFTPIATAIKMARPANRNTCRMLLRKCLAHRQKVMNWYAKNVRWGPEPCAPGEILTTKVPSTEPLFGTAYRFQSADNGKIHTTYWTLLIIMHTVISRARSLVAAYDIDPFMPDVDEQFGDADYAIANYYGDQIARAIPYHVQASMRSWGIHSVAFAFCQCAKTFVDCANKEKFDWSQKVFTVFGQAGFESGARLGEVLVGLWMMHQSKLAGMVVAETERRNPTPGTPEAVRKMHDVVGGMKDMPGMLRKAEEQEAVA